MENSFKCFKISEEQKKSFNENIEYIIDNTNKNLDYLNKNEKKKFFELSKEQVIQYFEKLLSTAKNWQKSFNDNNIKKIQEEYKETESYVSELELCLADNDTIFHCEGISYSLYQIGKILVKILKNENMNGDD